MITVVPTHIAFTGQCNGIERIVIVQGLVGAGLVGMVVGMVVVMVVVIVVVVVVVVWWWLWWL